MRKKITIIAVIAGLDLAFIFLMGGGLDLGEVAQISQVAGPLPTSQPYFVLTPGSPSPIEPEETVSDADEVDRAPSRPAKIDRNLTRLAPEKHEGTKAKAPAAVQPAKMIEPKTEFTDTIIWIKTSNIRRDPIENDPDIRIIPAISESPKIEPIKRSLFSRTVPIIKKPYEWVKELGSKLR